MNPVSPVIPGQDVGVTETTFAKDQPQYNPLPSIIIPGREGEVLSRWELTEEEKALLASGEGHIFLSLSTFGQPLQPIRLRVATPEMVMSEQREAPGGS